MATFESHQILCQGNEIQGILLTPGTSKPIQRQLGHLPSHCQTGRHEHTAHWKNPIESPSYAVKA